MTRATNTPATRKRRKKIIKLAEGYFGSKHKLFKSAKEQVKHSLVYAYRDRKVLKREMRKLWIIRINEFVRQHGLTYSNFIQKARLSQILLDRKQLSEMIVNQPEIAINFINKLKENSPHFKKTF